MVTSFEQILQIGKNRLREAGRPDADLDAELLLLDVVREPRSFLFVHRHDAADDYTAEAYFHRIDRRAEGEPLQYITGSQEFMRFPFKINEHVIIPRQDTEILVEKALKAAASMKPGIRILDLCCGSGAIGISMAHYLPKAKVTACDISEEALAVAARNAERNGVSRRIRFQKSDMFDIEKRGRQQKIKGHLDMILCNPPYIPTADIRELQKEVAQFEPKGALDGGEDGLHFYRILAEEAMSFLNPGGVLLMEIGSDQAEDVVRLFREGNAGGSPTVIQDLAGLDRVVMIPA